uniref:Enoyl reductase (ER) domain-containing protein n=1 Tax=Alexandrium monilatum TaxID=311494 RepID=A0A7S4W847_9DINO
MLTTNRVAKLTGVRRVELCVEDVPEPAPEEMLVKIQAAGICGSDLHYFRHGGLGSFKQPLPMLLGHEPAGIVVDVNGHAGFSVGDRVAIEPGRPCLTSPWSLRGRHNLCKEGSFMGAAGQPGCFSDFVCVTPFQCCKLPACVSFEAAALLEPVSVALHTVNLVEAKFTDTVVIFGAGTIGLCIFLVLRRAGIETIYMVDRLPFRRAFAVDFGATDAFPFDDAVAGLKKHTGGKGCSLVLDTAGDDASLEACLQCAAVGARVALVAIPEADHLKYNPHQARTKEVRLINPHRSTLLLREAVALFEDAAAAARLERLVSHRKPLAEVQEAFEMASGYSQGVIKIMLQPGLPQPRSAGRIGLLGVGVHTTVEYIKRLVDDAGVQVCYVATCEGEGEALDAGVEELCRQRGIQHLGRVDLSKEAARLAAFNCDLVLVGDLPTTPELLRGVAREGVVRTHFGLIPDSRASNPVMWAILEDQPQGATTHFVESDDGRSGAVVDTFAIETPARCRTSSVRDLLSVEAVRRLPGWIGSLRTGVFNMSAIRTVRLARGQRRRSAAQRGLGAAQAVPPGRAPSHGAPNGAYVSWGWQCAFLERFSDALDSVRTKRQDGTEIWFSVDTASRVQLDALPPPGVVVSAAADNSLFVVRACDGLVTCRPADPAVTPAAGSVLQSVASGEAGAGVPVDFVGAALAPPPAPGEEDATLAEPPPPPPPHFAPRPRTQQPVERPLQATNGSTASPPASAPQAPTVAAAPAAPAAAPSCGVPIYDLKFEEEFVAEFQQKAAEVLTSGRPLSESKFCREFEAAFAALVHAPHALVTSSGTMALNVALRAVGVRGRAVITPSNTFFATQVAVENAGGRALFAECEPEYMQLCPAALRAQLAAQPTGSVAAVVLVHVGGIIAPFAGELRDIAHEYGAALVEDAAHAHLSHLDDVGWAGTIGDIAAFSFFPTKVMTSGEGGMITTRSEALMKACREIKIFGADLNGGSSRFTCARPDGTNGRVPELSAALGLMECGRVERRVARRTMLVEEYARGLEGCPAYRLLRQPGGTCSYYKCIVKLNGIDREFLRSYAKARGVSFTGEVYHLGVHRMPGYAPEGGAEPGALPVTDDACANHACPPLYPELTVEDVRRVCEVMREAAAAAGAATPAAKA